MALISTTTAPTAFQRAGSVHESTVINSLPIGSEINRLNSQLCNTIALNNLFSLLKQHSSAPGCAGGGNLLTVYWAHRSLWAEGMPKRAHVARGAFWVLWGLCYQLSKRTWSEQMIATTDKWECATQSAASAWLLSTAVARETDVSLMETRISENFHLPCFHWSRQPFLWKQQLRVSGKEVTTHLLPSGVATSLCASDAMVPTAPGSFWQLSLTASCNKKAQCSKPYKNVNSGSLLEKGNLVFFHLKSDWSLISHSTKAKPHVVNWWLCFFQTLWPLHESHL